MLNDLLKVFNMTNLLVWKNYLIFWGFFLVAVQCLMILFSRRFTRNKGNNEEGNLAWLGRLLKYLALFTAWAVPCYLLILMESSVLLTDEARLLYHGLVNLVLFGALAFSLNRVLLSFSLDLSLIRTKITPAVFLLVFTLYCRRVWMIMPESWKTQGWSRAMVIISALLLSLALVLFIQKISPVLKDQLKISRKPVPLKIFEAGGQSLQILTIPIFLLTAGPALLTFFETGKVLSVLSRLSLMSALLWFLYRVTDSLLSQLSHYSENDSNKLDKTMVEMLRMLLGIVFIIISAIMVFRILSGRPLTSLLAGLGIGGIAVALAAQDTLKNFFGSIMIMVDKPFKIGERVLVEGKDGVIEAIGFRSTRIRTLTGNLVVIPNETMARVSIENIGKRASIRRLTNITIPYDTAPEKVERALEIIRDILNNHPGMDPEFPPRVNFNEFNADSLNIMVLYWYFPPNYWDYMDLTEKINLQILKAFNAEKIEFAFPSNTTYLEQPQGKLLHVKMDK